MDTPVTPAVAHTDTASRRDFLKTAAMGGAF